MERLLSWAKLSGFLLFVLAELSYIMYHLDVTHLLAHIIAEVCDALALVTIAFGLAKRVVVSTAPLVPGAAQHR